MPSLGMTFTAVGDGGGGGVAWSPGTSLPSSGTPDPATGGATYGPATDALIGTFTVGGSPLPSNAVVTGWAASVTRYGNSVGNSYDASVTAKVGGKGLSDYAATGVIWPSSPGAARGYGTGTTDTWGDTAPTYTQVNTSGGTVAISTCTDAAASATGTVTAMALTVYYTLTPPPDPFPVGYESMQVGQRARQLWPHLAMRGRSAFRPILAGWLGAVPVFAVQLVPVSFRLIPSF